MSDNKKPNEQKKRRPPRPPIPSMPEARRLIIETDGKGFRIVSSQLTLLEIKEIAREILELYKSR